MIAWVLPAPQPSNGYVFLARPSKTWTSQAHSYKGYVFLAEPSKRYVFLTQPYNRLRLPCSTTIKAQSSKFSHKTRFSKLKGQPYHLAMFSMDKDTLSRSPTCMNCFCCNNYIPAVVDITLNRHPTWADIHMVVSSQYRNQSWTWSLFTWYLKCAI